MFRHIVVAAAIAAIGLTATPAAAKTLNCTTVDFFSFDREDRQSAVKNMRKKYEITRSEKKINIKMTSPDYEPRDTEYYLVNDGLLGYLGIRSTAIGSETVVLGKRPSKGESHIDATIAVQGTFFVNTWRLHCK